MTLYAVKKLAKLAGVSVRTLHLYDELGLLKPAARTEAGYRLYGEQELFRLQQILFYRELDFPLQEIGQILYSPDFDLVQALENHKTALLSRRDRINVLLETIAHSIDHLKNEKMMNHEDLYKGLPKEKAAAWRREATEKYGIEAVDRSENYLRRLSKAQLEQLKQDQKDINARLVALMHESPDSPIVQDQIALHYANIREFWGTAGSGDPQAEAYAGLGQLYVDDERFSKVDGKPNKAYVLFLRDAMQYFAETKLK